MMKEISSLFNEQTSRETDEVVDQTIQEVIKKVNFEIFVFRNNYESFKVFS